MTGDSPVCLHTQVVSGFLAILWFVCFADIGISYALSDPKEIGSAHVVAAFQTVVSLAFFSFIGWVCAIVCELVLPSVFCTRCALGLNQRKDTSYA
jgi:hypothetical protein